MNETQSVNICGARLGTPFRKFGEVCTGIRIHAFLFLTFGLFAFGFSSFDSIFEPVTPLDIPKREVMREDISASEKIAESIVPEKVEPIFVSERELLSALRGEIEKKYAPDGDVRLSLLRSWEKLLLPSRSWGIEVVGYPHSGLASRMLFRVQVLAEEETVAEFQVPVNVEVWRDVYSARRRINRGSTFDISDYTIENIEILGHRYTTVRTDSDLSEYELVQTVSEGKPLLWRDISLKPLVRKGQVVDVVAVEGFMHISMKGVALENGARDEFVSVRNLSSRKDFQGQVRSENRGEVYF